MIGVSIFIFGGFIVGFGKFGNDIDNEAIKSATDSDGNSGNSGNVGISILPKSTSGILTVDGKSGTGGPVITLYALQFNTAGAGGAGYVYCEVTDILPPTPVKCICANIINGSIIMFVFVLHIKFGSTKLIKGGFGINPFILSYAIAFISSLVGVLASICCCNSSFVGMTNIHST